MGTSPTLVSNEHFSIAKQTVKRTVNDSERQTELSYRVAKTIEGATEIAGGVDGLLKYFNLGRWQDLRTKASNRLAGLTPLQRNYNRMLRAYMAAAKCDEATAGAMVKQMEPFKNLDAETVAVPPTTTEYDFASDESDEDESESETATQ